MAIAFAVIEKPWHPVKPVLESKLNGVQMEICPNYNNHPGWIAKACLVGGHHGQRFEIVDDQRAAERRAHEMARELIDREIVRLMNLREELKP